MVDPFKSTETEVQCSHPFEVVIAPTGLLHDGSVVLAIRTDPAAKIRMEGTIAHSVAFGESWATVSVLDGIHRQVSLIVDRLGAG